MDPGQPLHNNAIPAHPGVQQQIQQAVNGAEQAQAPAPTEATPSPSVQGLWDAFDGPKEAPVSPPEPPPAPPVVSAPQPPAAPTTPPEVPMSVEEMLSGPTSVEAPPATQAVPEQQPQATGVAPAPIDFAAAQKQAIDYLMANEYKFSDAERTQLISAPDEVLPQLAARMHVRIATQLAQQVAQAIPHLIQQHLDGHVRAQRAESEFFARYPKLNRAEWKPLIAESLQMVKNMNPQAGRDEIIAKGAALAAFQINSRFSNRQAPQPPQRPGFPQQPYVPVAPGGGAAPPMNPQDANNIWANLAADPDFNPW